MCKVIHSTGPCTSGLCCARTLCRALRNGVDIRSSTYSGWPTSRPGCRPRDAVRRRQRVHRARGVLILAESGAEHLGHRLGQDHGREGGGAPAARGGGAPAAPGAPPAPPSSTYAPVSVTETEGGSEFGDGAFASILPPDGADDGAGEPPKLSQDEFARLNESRKNNTHPLAMSGGAPASRLRAQKIDVANSFFIGVGEINVLSTLAQTLLPARGARARRAPVRSLRAPATAGAAAAAAATTAPGRVARPGRTRARRASAASPASVAWRS